MPGVQHIYQLISIPKDWIHLLPLRVINTFSFPFMPSLTFMCLAFWLQNDIWKFKSWPLNCLKWSPSLAFMGRDLRGREFESQYKNLD